MSYKKTNEEFIDEIKGLVGDEYTFLEPYQTAQIKLCVKHNKCGYEYQVSPHKFLAGRRCPKCSGHMIYTPDQFNRKIHGIVGDEYTVLTDYVRTNKKVKFKHNKCGYEFDMRPNCFLQVQRCPKCQNQIHYTEEMFIKKLTELYPNEFTLVSKFTKTDDPVTLRHNECGKEFTTLAKHVLHDGIGCTWCSKSRGERMIRGWLDLHHIDHEPQKKFSDCRDKNPLPFDFYLTKYNMLIEFDGEQHYGIKTTFPSESIEHTMKHDVIKNGYAKSRGIKLVRISYKHRNVKDIDSILSSLLLKE